MYLPGNLDIFLSCLIQLEEFSSLLEATAQNREGDVGAGFLPLRINRLDLEGVRTEFVDQPSWHLYPTERYPWREDISRPLGLSRGAGLLKYIRAH